GILDTQLRIQKEANVITDSTCHTLILTGRDADKDKIRQLNREHVYVDRLEKKYTAIAEVLAYLGKREIMSMLVEGGATVQSSFIKEAAFQERLVYMSPKIIGGKDAYPIIGGSGIEKMQAATELVFTNIESFGPDVKITAKPK